jgi:hypothetical protein
MNAYVEFVPRTGNFYLTPDRKQREAGAQSFYLYPNDIRSRDEFNARSSEFHWMPYDEEAFVEFRREALQAIGIRRGRFMPLRGWTSMSLVSMTVLDTPTDGEAIAASLRQLQKEGRF